MSIHQRQTICSLTPPQAVDYVPSPRFVLGLPVSVSILSTIPAGNFSKPPPILLSTPPFPQAHLLNLNAAKTASTIKNVVSIEMMHVKNVIVET